MNPTPTTCIATSFGIPKRLQASGIRRSDPPATPEAPAALAAERTHRISAVGKSTWISSVCAAASAMVDCNSSSCLIDSCAKWNGDGVSIPRPNQDPWQSFMLTGMLAAELRVKNAVSPLSFRQRKHKVGMGFLRRQINVISGFIISATKSMVPTSNADQDVRIREERRVPARKIVVKISPMIPNGAQLMIHFTAVAIASEIFSKHSLCHPLALLRAMPSMMAHARIRYNWRLPVSRLDSQRHSLAIFSTSVTPVGGVIS